MVDRIHEAQFETSASTDRFKADDQAAEALAWMDGPANDTGYTEEATGELPIYEILTGELPVCEVGKPDPSIIILSEPDLTNGGICKAVVTMRSKIIGPAE